MSMAKLKRVACNKNVFFYKTWKRSCPLLKLYCLIIFSIHVYFWTKYYKIKIFKHYLRCTTDLSWLHVPVVRVTWNCLCKTFVYFLTIPTSFHSWSRNIHIFSLLCSSPLFSVIATMHETVYCRYTLVLVMLVVGGVPTCTV